MRGVPLREIWSESDRFMEFLKPLNLQEPIGAIRSVRQAIRNLHSRTLNQSTFSTRGFSEDEYVAGLANYGSRHFAHFYYINKMLTQYLWKEYDAALATAQISTRYLKDSPGMLHAAEHYFLSGLIQAAQPNALLVGSGPAPDEVYNLPPNVWPPGLGAARITLNTSRSFSLGNLRG